MLDIVLTPKILGPQKSGALGLSLFSLMVNPLLKRTNRRRTTRELFATVEIIQRSYRIGW